ARVVAYGPGRVLEGSRPGRVDPMIEVGANSYGKSAIRLVRVDRDGDRHRVRDLTVAIALEGDFAASYIDGDNSGVIATDTMKNTTYALAADHLTGPIEQFGLVLGRHFSSSLRALERTWPSTRIRRHRSRV